MRIELTDTESSELRMLLQGTLSELSHEIADTDNAGFRKVLRNRRTALEAIVHQLDAVPTGRDIRRRASVDRSGPEA